MVIGTPILTQAIGCRPHSLHISEGMVPASLQSLDPNTEVGAMFWIWHASSLYDILQQHNRL